MSTTTKIESKELVSLVEPHINIDNGVATIDQKAATDAAFAQMGTDAKAVKAAYDAVAATGNAIAQSFNEKAQDHLKDNSSVNVITAQAKVGDETWKMATHREQTHRNPQTGEEIVSKGGLTVSRVIATRNTELKSIKTLAKERGIKTL